MEAPDIPDSPLRARFLGSAQSNYSQTLVTPDDSPEYSQSIHRSKSADHLNVRRFNAMHDTNEANGANGFNGVDDTNNSINSINDVNGVDGVSYKPESYEQPPVQLQW